MESPDRSPDPSAPYQKALSLHGSGRFAEAANLYRELLSKSPQDHLLLAGLGKTELALGNFEHAANLFGQSLQLAPSQPETLTNLGVALIYLGRLDDALACFEQAIRLKPELAQAHHNRGHVHNMLNRPGEALADYDRAIALKPDSAEMYASRGHTLRDLNRPQEALASYGRALALRPDWAETHLDRGNMLQLLGRPEEALASYDRAIALNPALGGAHSNRGNVLHDMKRLDEALASYDQAIALKPDYAEAYSNRGGVLKDLNRLEEALRDCDRAIALDPGLADAHVNRGVVLRDLRRLEESLASYDQAIALQPGHAEAYWNKSLVYLHAGNFEEGWPLYEWRWKGSQRKFFRDFPQPLWLGTQPLAGKRLLIHTEQGLGDFIQFCRYVPMAEELGATVILEVPAALLSLASTLPGTRIIVEAGPPLPAFDLHCPVMSLPLAFKTTLASIPAQVPYLHADHDKRQLWRQRLGEKTRPRIGLVWSGNTAHKINHIRSIPLASLRPLLQLPLEFHALQKIIRPEDAAVLADFPQLHVHGEQLGDFSDTAALAQEMDLVISVCTSVAHLAAAMARPTWILLHFSPDYRWMLERADSPWYPTATLFRQPAIGDWASVIAEVAARLQRIAESRGS